MEELMTTHEVAKMLHIHVNTVRRWDKRGILKAIRVGSRRDRRFKLSDIEAIISKFG